MNKSKSYNNVRAFTLVELAIVIVIIGLLVGGVLQGQELINQAKIRSQIKQLEGYNAAALTFKGKYGFIPGDLTTEAAAKFGFQALILSNGGNNILDAASGNIPNTSASGEPATFFFNLSEKKLVKDSIKRQGADYSIGAVFPKASLGDMGIAAFSHTDGIYYFLGTTTRDTTSNFHRFINNSDRATLIPSDAANIDMKIDDGTPSLGIVRAVIVTSSAATNFSNDTQTNSCLGNDDQSYNFTTNSVLCRIIIKSAL